MEMDIKSFDELELIGSGGFGRVTKFRDRADAQIYAIKVIPLKESVEENSKYKREIDLLSNKNKNFIVKYFNSWIQNNCLYIQMELCDESLTNVIQLKAKAFERIKGQVMNIIEYYISCELLKEILECVQYLHELNPPVIHRDLKPENILIKYNNNSNRFVRICDMGLAVTHDKTGVSHTQNQGTIKYIAPEVSQSNHYSTKADIYSLGVIAQDLYDFNIHESNSLMGYQQDKLFNRFKLLESMVLEMIKTPRWKYRPSCGDLLSSYNDWSIKKDMVKEYENFETFEAKLKTNENKFFINYLRHKLNDN